MGEVTAGGEDGGVNGAPSSRGEGSGSGVPDNASEGGVLRGIEG